MAARYSENCAVAKVPIVRYFAVVGSLLLAMLFIADWLLPKGQTQSDAGGKADKPTIVLRSDQKWPERVVFDTSAPIVVSLAAPPLWTRQSPDARERPLPCWPDRCREF